MYYTGICEDAFSKRTIISVITGLNKFLSDTIVTVTGNKISTNTFSGSVNRGGYLFLSGAVIKGVSLFELYRSYEAQNAFSDTVKMHLSIFIDVVKASELIKNKMGFYSPLILNSIFIDPEDKSITFLPVKLVDFLNKYQDVDKQNTLYFCIDNKLDFLNPDESAFTRSVGKLIYLHLLKGQDTPGDPVFDIADFVKDTPRFLSDTMWDVLHGKHIGIQRLLDAIDDSLNKENSSTPAVVSFWRSRAVITFKYTLSMFFARRKKIIFLLLIITGISTYLFLDFLLKNKNIDYTAGLDSEKVVELYFHAVDNLKLDIIETIFYKRAGKEIRNELSTLYVMIKLQTVYGNIPSGPEDMGSIDEKYRETKVYGIEDLEIQKIKGGESPIFSAKYKKILNTGGENTVYSIEETIYLKKYHDHWYIVESNRNLVQEK